MPTYEYICKNCGHEFEMVQRMADPVKKKCPQCGQLKLCRLIGSGVQAMASKERVSYAMGVHPSRIAEAEKMYGGSKYRPDGSLIIKSRADKVKKMHERGLVEYTKPDIDKQAENRKKQRN
ncbi:MAG: zinc ribbon domain-containing protein [Patescibacteria group bacterium]